MVFKKIIFTFYFFLIIHSSFGQYKKDGTPDMRYKANKQTYGSSYSTPSYSTPNYSTPNYSTPNYNANPTKKDGSPDMRYKSNKDIYGTSNSSSNVYYTNPRVSNTTNGYIKSNNTYVETYQSTKPNKTNLDNYSTSGNINPYTGKEGSRAQDNSAEAFNYGAGYETKTGAKGGQYYINRMGKKTYVPKTN
jgi:hypothetical protein